MEEIPGKLISLQSASQRKSSHLELTNPPPFCHVFTIETLNRTLLHLTGGPNPSFSKSLGLQLLGNAVHVLPVKRNISLHALESSSPTLQNKTELLRFCHVFKGDQLAMMANDQDGL